MPYTLDYDPAGFIKLAYEGQANVIEIQAAIAAVLVLAKERRCFRALTDLRAIQSDLSMSELFPLPDRERELARAARLPVVTFRRALVVSARRQTELYQFFENVAVNRSQTVKVFVTLEPAVAWLLAD